jgi:hypothetical protein
MKAEPTHSQVADRPFSADLGGNEDVLQAFGKPSAPRSDGNFAQRHLPATDGGFTMNSRVPLLDPRQQYPAPPFPDQPQAAPGRAGRMDPLPDHGEESYRGSAKLAGRRALVTGGDSGIGRAVAIAFAREGADVAISYLPQEEPDATEVTDLIKGEGRKAIALPGDIKDEAWCRSW